jgi:diacylglycerol kinase
MPDKKFSWKARGKSFTYAWQGIKQLYRAEHNFRIHFYTTLLVMVIAIALKVSRMEAVALVLTIAFVWVTEMLNTAIEKTADLVTTEFHPLVKIIKDVAAAAVLISALAAVVVGGIIFIPKLLNLLHY